MIDSFMGKYRWLSNFHLAPVWGWRDPNTGMAIFFPSVEHAYQAGKTLDPMERLLIRDMTASACKIYSKNIKIRENWLDIRVAVMDYFLWQKFTRHEDMKKKLLATGDEKLVEGNTWGDTFWGVCNGYGNNTLGILLMHIRQRLREGKDTHEIFENYMKNQELQLWN